ncbi:rRNA 2'-O-methyltransferase fibrillarin-like [Struthio camelus]|uniref:rRNA 2'-O-methyltransferase fibrillarin-like n=1 Tax=Struthio camelus TaxID=8801 RepID=UPI00360400B3
MAFLALLRKAAATCRAGGAPLAAGSLCPPLRLPPRRPAVKAALRRHLGAAAESPRGGGGGGGGGGGEGGDSLGWARVSCGARNRLRGRGAAVRGAGRGEKRSGASARRGVAFGPAAVAVAYRSRRPEAKRSVNLVGAGVRVLLGATATAVSGTPGRRWCTGEQDESSGKRDRKISPLSVYAISLLLKATV